MDKTADKYTQMKYAIIKALHGANYKTISLVYHFLVGYGVITDKEVSQDTKTRK